MEFILWNCFPPWLILIESERYFYKKAKQINVIDETFDCSYLLSDILDSLGVCSFFDFYAVTK